MAGIKLQAELRRLCPWPQRAKVATDQAPFSCFSPALAVLGPREELTLAQRSMNTRPGSGAGERGGAGPGKR